MQIKIEKKTNKAMRTLFANPKKCLHCNVELEDLSYIMIGIGYKCPKCHVKWLSRYKDMYLICS